MSDSTSINQLPTDTSINPGPPTNQPEASAPGSSTEANSLMALDNTTIQHIVNGIQKANATGSTSLPSRDIPQSMEPITNDPQQNINYVPQEEKYNLEIEETEDQVLNNYNYKKQNENWYEDYYDIFQTPILVAILFFLFQIPVVKKTFVNNLPFVVNGDGNMNLNGMLIYSFLFGSIFFLFSKLINF